MILVDVLEFLINEHPGMPEHELAQAIPGESGYQQKVHQDCSMLFDSGRAVRRMRATRLIHFAVIPNITGRSRFGR